MNRKTLFLTQSALIAAIYVVLTYVSNLVGLAGGVIQVRISEALTVLPAFMPSSVSGLFVGCLTSNILIGAPLPDVICGSLATLLGALGTRYFGKNSFLAALFPILSNTIIIPLVLKFAYGVEQGIFFIVVSVFVGEAISCGVLGTILYETIKKTEIIKNQPKS